MVFTLTTGAIFVMWLGEQITERGIGNGQSLLIIFSILERLWPATIQLASFVKGGVVSPIGVLFYFAVMVGGHRGGGGHDDRGAPHPDPDPPQGHGARAHPRGPEDVHPDPASSPPA